MSKPVTLQRDVLQTILKERALRSRETRHLHRLHCVTLVAQGHACADVARWFGETPRTVQRWVNAYQQGGADALRDDARPGRPSRLTHNQWIKLQERLSRPPREAGYEQEVWDSGLVQRCLAEMLNVRFSIRQCQRLLRILRDEGTPLAGRRVVRAGRVSEG